MRLGRFGILGVLALVAIAAGGATFAAYTATTQNDSNRIEAGSVKLSDNGDGTSLMSMASGVPGDTRSACIKVTFDGSLASTVRLYGTTTGSGLDQYLDLKVTRGTYTPSDPAFKSCANFQPDATNYVGAGNGVIYTGTLQGFPDDYATSVVDLLNKADGRTVQTANGPWVLHPKVATTDADVQQGVGVSIDFIESGLLVRVAHAVAADARQHAEQPEHRHQLRQQLFVLLPSGQRRRPQCLVGDRNRDRFS